MLQHMDRSLELQHNLAQIQSISRQKSKKKRLLTLLNCVIVSAELLLFFLLFHSIFNWRIEHIFLDNYLSHYLYLFLFIVGVFVIQAAGRGLYRLKSPYNWVGEMGQLIKVVFFTFMMTAGMLFVLKISINYSRVVIGLFFVGMFLTSFLIRIIKRWIISWLTSSNLLSRNVLIIGAGKVGQVVYNKMQNTKSLGYNVIGFLDDQKQGPEIKGALSEIEEVLKTNEVDEIIVTIPSERGYIYSLLKNVYKYKVRLKVIPELYNVVSSKLEYDQVEPFPFMEIGKAFVSGWRAFSKRALDLVLSIVGTVILIPIFIVLWASVKISSPGPAVFKQHRIGKDGKKFYIYKFRSMVMDAEKKLKENPELYRRYVENNYKLDPKDDPRITMLGRFLRKSSLDELPQLINVLKGEMSLVGPRPVVEEELREYDQLIFDFLSVKPGITGYWQVSGRSEAGYPERVDIELYYVYNQSVALDIKILFQTVAAVIKRKGAY
jgi:exopolysaccharide biosynthesis polyprenyl glycosylphosphotransferase